ncbi:MAG: hypothetical protein HKL96_01880 [Phycisphaerales bacterium]|nr:hypothetical protein [Phycisphaerales bacterium]
MLPTTSVVKMDTAGVDKAFLHLMVPAIPCLTRHNCGNTMGGPSGCREGLGFPTSHLLLHFKPPQKPAWIADGTWSKLPDSITLREIRRTVIRKGYRPIAVCIATTLLDPQAYPADKLIEPRLSRWMIETNIRHLKIRLGMDVLKCKTLDGVRQERLIFLLVYNLIRIIILHAARRQGVSVNRLSFADTLAWIRYGDLREYPALIVNPLRPGRSEPRVIKRQKK